MQNTYLDLGNTPETRCFENKIYITLESLSPHLFTYLFIQQLSDINWESAIRITAVDRTEFLPSSQKSESQWTRRSSILQFCNPLKSLQTVIDAKATRMGHLSSCFTDKEMHLRKGKQCVLDTVCSCRSFTCTTIQGHVAMCVCVWPERPWHYWSHRTKSTSKLPPCWLCYPECYFISLYPFSI
jgi:hypothetical protein